MSIDIDKLRARLPELEWKLRSLDSYLLKANFPRGLFNDRLEITASTCINEITEDLNRLEKLSEQQESFAYLAKKIAQKINVLVHFCKKNHQKKTQAPSLLKTMSTRNQCLQNLESEIGALKAQKAALQASLETVNTVELQLKLQAELGDIERMLTDLNAQFSQM